MRIALMEDEQTPWEHLQTYSKAYERKIEVSCHTSGTEFLRSFRNQYDMILLDVSMPGMDGMQTAKEIRRLDGDVAILFITQMAQYAIRHLPPFYPASAMEALYHFGHTPTGRRGTELIGTILGKLPMGRMISNISGSTWVQVQSQGQVVEAIDLVGCRKGERVLVISGAAVTMACQGCPAEYAVAAVLSDNGNSC